MRALVPKPETCYQETAGQCPSGAHRQKFPRDTGRGERQNDSHFTPRSENKAMTSVFTTSTQHGFEALTSAVGKKKKGKAYRLEKR